MLGGAGTVPSRALFQVDIDVFGRKGMALLDVERPRNDVHRADGRTFSLPTSHKPGSRTCVEPLRVLTCSLKGKAVENRSPAWLSTRVVQILEAALTSANSGKVEVIA